MKAENIGCGEVCPVCKWTTMCRMTHPKNWRPKRPFQNYFIFWDFCAVCRRVQHYEQNRRIADENGNLATEQMEIEENQGGEVSAMREAQAARELCALLCLSE